MLAGGFGLAAIVKARRPELPLWSLMLSAQLLTILFIILYFAGVESYSNVPGTNGGYGNVIFNASYTHSLAGALVISIVAMIASWIPWGRVNGLIIGGMVFSNWILALIVHRADMPILPGSMNAGLPLLGFGLWEFPIVAVVVELVLVLAGAYLYYHAAMRTAVRAERQDLKAGGKTQGNYRQQALLASVVMALLLVGTLAASYFVS